MFAMGFRPSQAHRHHNYLMPERMLTVSGVKPIVNVGLNGLGYEINVGSVSGFNTYYMTVIVMLVYFDRPSRVPVLGTKFS